MNLSYLPGGEAHPVYRKVATANNTRQIDLLRTLIEAAVELGRPYLSHSIITALNFHAIVGLHHEAGKYRTTLVAVGDHTPPPDYDVEPLMDDFVNQVNRA